MLEGKVVLAVIMAILIHQAGAGIHFWSETAMEMDMIVIWIPLVFIIRSYKLSGPD